MKRCFTNATVMWDELEITRRESLIREIPIALYREWKDLNPAVSMHRVETPILTPEDMLKTHIETGFELIKTEKRGYLRPETTAGTYEAFHILYGDNFSKKTLPVCLWQVGCSFRDEQNADTMRATKLRLRQFYQMEFQLFVSRETHAPYLDHALMTLCKLYGGEGRVADELPHYSSNTMDWYLRDLEVAGLSVRHDWPHGMVFEVAIGLDRLVALLLDR